MNIGTNRVRLRIHLTYWKRRLSARVRLIYRAREAGAGGVARAGSETYEFQHDEFRPWPTRRQSCLQRPGPGYLRRIERCRSVRQSLRRNAHQHNSRQSSCPVGSRERIVEHERATRSIVPAVCIGRASGPAVSNTIWGRVRLFPCPFLRPRYKQSTIVVREIATNKIGKSRCAIYVRLDSPSATSGCSPRRKTSDLICRRQQYKKAPTADIWTTRLVAEISTSGKQSSDPPTSIRRRDVLRDTRLNLSS